MKNVLVFYSHNLSASYLADMQLDDPIELAPNFDSSDIIREINVAANNNQPHALNNRKSALACLCSVDGIQFHHIKNDGPRHDVSLPIRENSFEVRVAEMEEYIAAKGEKLDAIVLPTNANHYESTFRWLREMRERHPQVKILVEKNYIPYQPSSEPRYEEKFVEPLSKEDELTWAGADAVIKSGTAGYQLNTDVVDIVTCNVDSATRANALRGMLGMEPLKAPACGRY